MAIKKVSKQLVQGSNLNKNALDPSRIPVSTKLEIDNFRMRVDRMANGSILVNEGPAGAMERGQETVSYTFKPDRGLRAMATGIKVAQYAGGALFYNYIDNIGWMTNDQTAQNKVNNVKNIASTIGGATALGATFGNPALGFAVGVALEAIQLATESQKMARSVRDAQREGTLNTARLGLLYTQRGRT